MYADETILILKNEANLMPKLKQPEILKLVHKEHFGYEKTIQNLKDKVWWHNLNNDVRNVVSGCQSCIENADKQLEQMEVNKEDVKAQSPMSHLHIDFVTFNLTKYIVIIHSYS